MIKSNEERIYIILACFMLFNLFSIDPYLYFATIIAITFSEIALMGFDQFNEILGQ